MASSNLIYLNFITNECILVITSDALFFPNESHSFFYNYNNKGIKTKKFSLLLDARQISLI